MSASRVAKRAKDERAKAKREKREAKRRERQERRTDGLSTRDVGTREAFKRVLIVCEGEQTEPNYLRRFPIRSGDVVTIDGAGKNTDSLVRHAERLEGEGDYDEVWVVFDRDSFKVEQVNSALQRAENNGFKVAFSNEAFELWYLLHFEYCDAALTRDTYKKRLSSYLNRPYQKNDPTTFDTLKPYLNDALRNADRLQAHHGSVSNLDAKPLSGGVSLVEAKPITTVHYLVRRLLELAPK